MLYPTGRRALHALFYSSVFLAPSSRYSSSYLASLSLLLLLSFSLSFSRIPSFFACSLPARSLPLSLSNIVTHRCLFDLAVRSSPRPPSRSRLIISYSYRSSAIALRYLDCFSIPAPDSGPSVCLSQRQLTYISILSISHPLAASR